MKNLNRKNVVITGAASGIGKTLAYAFAKERANLALIDIDRKKLEDVERDLDQRRVKVYGYRCDISNPNDMVKTYKMILNQFDSVDVLINNAGIVVGKEFITSGYEEIKRVLDINLLGSIWMTRLVLPGMLEKNSGTVVNIASAAGMVGIPRLSDYCASKFGLVGFTDSLRLELKKMGCRGVHVTCVCPSFINTGMFQGFRKPLFSRVLSPEEVAGAVLKAVKKEKPYVRLPFVVKLIPFLKLLPTSLEDKLSYSLGLSRSMDHFHGGDSR